MILKDKIIPVALVAALLGGSVGAFVAHRNTEPATASYNTTAPSAPLFDRQNTRQISDTTNSQVGDEIASKANDVADAGSYRTGFLDGFSFARNGDGGSTRGVVTRETVVPTTRVVYRNTPVRTRSYASNNTRRVYYDYNQPAKRSFWQKHRDKLTVAMGTGGGALLGGLIGGKKGAAIGALAGGGGSAIYTYGIRKRNRRY
ncbi:MAG: hypothetical protein QOH63_3462 [Acidobacteriota bacterium]|jgi:hypothetical protein|nr:hypothetical protein [Acidobacteriota bacterium]MDT5063003.1 hypothetical protein [Acidobacteriota bacterium]